MNRRGLVALALATGLLSGCAKGTFTGPSSERAQGSEGFSTEMGYCVDEINRYRATIALPPLDRAAPLEDYATDSARIDTAARQPHTHFRDTNGGGVAQAETELLLWPNADARAVLQQGIRTMWKEGPGGSHYDVLTGSYGTVGCGIFVDGNMMTISQDFK